MALVIVATHPCTTDAAATHPYPERKMKMQRTFCHPICTISVYKSKQVIPVLPDTPDPILLFCMSLE